MEKVLEHVSDNLEVEVIPNKVHEYVVTSNEVTKGYGVAGNTIRMHKFNHSDELIEGKHFIMGVNNIDGVIDTGKKEGATTYWTKRGIVRLGFFIKSERAKMFRDWAEDLVINKVEEAQRIQHQVQQLSLFPEPAKRNHNRLTKDRLVDILADVARIEDKALRISLVDKLTNIKA
ncbi:MULTISPECIES: hypothetical protein [Bacteroides]|uniref:hypothetical protein n=1 Tax=Bacteroides TaxID=816 RepID=UPI00202F0D32|nr:MULTISPECIES: hypothetical protein [Bacteroides]MCM0301292.1 hypothetical protein [Bacteroides fragilis]MDV6195226.1 hypothetical protein [Bacteroides hominis (ex Liu et al. 2022)]